MTATAETGPDFGVLISRLYRAFEHELWSSLANQGFVADLSPRHGAVLAHLRPEGVHASDLSRACGQHKQIVGTIVDELEALGHVARRPDPTDRRAKLVVPTERGLAEIATAGRVISGLEHRHAQRLGAVRYEQFKQAAREITEA
jgi:DNA-binding MarR family transcriptional regulator